MDSTNLKWVPWGGNLPDDAVSIYNSYVGRTDYVAKYGGSAGFYTPDKGPYCFYAYGDKEIKVSQFEILVNEGNLENLVWKGGSYGNVPPNSVESSSSDDKLYVGKNKYGLGKVHVKNTAFFLPWEGKEYYYKEYDVLTYDTEILRQEISNVVYDTKQAKTLKVPPEVIGTSSVDNHGCREVEETVTLQRTHQEEKRWDSSFAVKAGISTTITAGVPEVSSVSVEFSVETTFELSQGATTIDSKSYSSSVKVPVPPGHSCAVKMVGNKYSADIPYTAILTRKFSSGKTTSGPISGIYKGVNIVDVHTVVERCTPIPNFLPCSE